MPVKLSRGHDFREGLGLRGNVAHPATLLPPPSRPAPPLPEPLCRGLVVVVRRGEDAVVDGEGAAVVGDRRRGLILLRAGAPAAAF
jgi:hypothetical protein